MHCQQTSTFEYTFIKINNVPFQFLCSVHILYIKFKAVKSVNSYIKCNIFHFYIFPHHRLLIIPYKTTDFEYINFIINCSNVSFLNFPHNNLLIIVYIHLQSSKYFKCINGINPLNSELNPICHLLALLGAHPILHISRIRVNIQYI